MSSNQNMNGGRVEPSGSALPPWRRAVSRIVNRRLIRGGAIWLIAPLGIAVVISSFVLSTNCARTGTGINVAGVQLVACSQTPAVTAKKTAPVKVERIEGTKLNRLTLVAEAAKRLDIQTASVREEPVVRTRKVGGEVVASPTDLSKAWVRVFLNESDLKKVRRVESALVLPLTGGAGATGLKALPVKALAVGDPEEAVGALYYEVTSTGHHLAPGQRVFVELTLVGSGAQRKVIPYTAVLYDPKGDTWTYTSPEPLVFVRHPIVVDYIERDLAVLRAGPPAGTAVVTVGGAELFGAEFGVGK